MTSLASSWLTLLLSLLVLSVSAQNYTITTYNVNGSGCAPTTVSSSTTPDGEDVSLKYSDFTAYTGPGFTYADGRKNCQLTLSVQVPPGYQFAFDKFSHTATYSLGSGVTGSFGSRYYFQASLNQASGNGSLEGPAKTDSSILASSFRPLVWSPCGQNAIVGIDTSIHVDNGDSSASGSLTVRSTPANSFTWRTC